MDGLVTIVLFHCFDEFTIALKYRKIPMRVLKCIKSFNISFKSISMFNSGFIQKMFQIKLTLVFMILFILLRPSKKALRNS